MIGTRITITDTLAIATAKLAAENRGSSGVAVTIAYDDEYDVTEWLVELDAGYGKLTFVVNDETGESRVAGLGERIPRWEVER